MHFNRIGQAFFGRIAEKSEFFFHLFRFGKRNAQRSGNGIRYIRSATLDSMIAFYHAEFHQGKLGARSAEIHKYHQ